MTDAPRSPARPPAAHRHQESPVDLPPAADGEFRPLRFAAGTIAVATLVLGLTNAGALNDWAAEQTPSPTMVVVTDATEAWLALTRRWHLTAPRDAAHGRWTAAQRARFGGQPAADPD